MGGYSATSDLDLGKKVGNLDFWDEGGAVFFNFGLGLREKVGNLDFWDGEGGGGYSATLDLDLGKKLEIWIFGMGRGEGCILQLWIWT